MKLNIVKFPDGKYAVRKGWIFHSYIDKNWPREDFTWTQQSSIEMWCKTNYDNAKRIFSSFGEKTKIEIVE